MCLCISRLQVLLEYWCLFVCLYLYHCWYSLSTLRYSMEKALRTTNQTVFAAHINLSVGSAYPNQCCQLSGKSARFSGFCACLAENFCIWRTADFLADFYESVGGPFAKSRIREKM